MKKLIALVLAVAMMLTLGVLTVSAESAPALVLEGAEKVAVGDEYVVSIRLNDASNVVGGFQGELAYTGATVKEIAVNPQVNEYNNNGADDTIIADDGDSVNFVTLGNVKGNNPETRIWFKVTFEITGEATFALEEVVFSNKEAAAIEGIVGTLNVDVATAEEAVVTLNKAGVIAQTAPNDQAIVIEAGISVPDGVEVEEYGVVFYPTALLGGAELTVETEGAVKAFLTKGSANFDKHIEEGYFSALLHFNFSTDENAAKFLGTKVSARVYYKVNGEYVYSFNSSDKYIQGGVADKAALNTLLDYSENIAENKSSVSPEDFTAAKAGLNTSNENWFANRCTVLLYVVENAKAVK